MKRFWKQAEIAHDESGWGVALDGKRVRTPAGGPLLVPAKPLAEAIAGEWNAAGESVDLRDMPLTGLASAAIDVVSADPQAFAAGLAKYGESDLACYRAEAPRALVARQAEKWDGLLAWARRRYDVDFRTTCGILHVPQPDVTVQRLAHAVAALDAFRLAGLSPLVTIGGSLVTGLAVLEGAISPQEGWAAVSIDEQWQLDQWGDAEAQAALDARRRDFLAAARFLDLLEN